MEAQLKFNLTLANGTVVQKEYQVPATKARDMINQLFSVFMQLGYIVEDEETGSITAYRVDECSVVPPTVTLASPAEASAVVKRSGLITEV